MLGCLCHFMCLMCLCGDVYGMLGVFNMSCQYMCSGLCGSGCEFEAVAFCLQIKKEGDGWARARVVER